MLHRNLIQAKMLCAHSNLKPAAVDESKVRFEFVEKHSPNLFFLLFLFWKREHSFITLAVALS